MSAQRLTVTFAGFFILASLLLAQIFGQVDLTKVSWLWFTIFVGANLAQSGISGFCPLNSIFKAAGAK